MQVSKYLDKNKVCDMFTQKTSYPIFIFLKDYEIVWYRESWSASLDLLHGNFWPSRIKESTALNVLL